jgi:hypothetical protein
MTPGTLARPHSGAHLALVALVCGVLAGCAATPTGTPPPPPAPAPAPTPAAEPDPAPPRPPSPALTAFENRHRQVAEAASRRGHWAEALWALDVLLALQPRDADLLKRRQQAQDAAQAAAQDKWQAARAAQTRGDSETAARLYLEVLALTPTRSEAAEALRQMEQDRVRRQHLGQLSRNVLTRRGSVMEPSPVNLLTAPRPGSEGNNVEHASLLAAQGDLDSAIQLIRPAATAPNPDPAARQLLADLYFRQAEALASTDKAAAIAALERAVQAEPGHAKAVARLKELRAPLPPGTKTIPAKPAPAAKR